MMQHNPPRAVRFDVAAAAREQAERTGNWTGIAISEEAFADLATAVRGVLDAVDKARMRGQEIRPVGLRIALTLLSAVAAEPAFHTGSQRSETP